MRAEAFVGGVFSGNMQTQTTLKRTQPPHAHKKTLQLRGRAEAALGPRHGRRRLRRGGRQALLAAQELLVRFLVVSVEHAAQTARTAVPKTHTKNQPPTNQLTNPSTTPPQKKHKTKGRDVGREGLHEDPSQPRQERQVRDGVVADARVQEPRRAAVGVGRRRAAAGRGPAAAAAAARGGVVRAGAEQLLHLTCACASKKQGKRACAVA